MFVVYYATYVYVRTLYQLYPPLSGHELIGLHGGFTGSAQRSGPQFRNQYVMVRLYGNIDDLLPSLTKQQF